MNPNQRNILVVANDDGAFIRLRTYVRGQKRGYWLLIDKVKLETLLSAADGKHTMYDTDMGCYIEANKWKDKVSFKIAYLSTAGDGYSVTGYKRDFEVPVEKLENLLRNHEDFRSLYRVPARKARVSCHFSPQKVKNVLGEKLHRNAFRKAMRDCFQWSGDTVTIYPSWDSDFDFDARGGWPISGGLCLHHGTVKVNGKEYPKLYYSVHT